MIQARLVAMLEIALLVAALAGWGFWERSGKMSALVDVERLTGQIAVQGQQIAEQNTAVENLKKTAAQAHARGRQAAIAAAQAAEGHKAEIESLEARIRAGIAPTGKPVTCPAGQAVSEIRGAK